VKIILMGGKHHNQIFEVPNNLPAIHLAVTPEIVPGTKVYGSWINPIRPNDLEIETYYRTSASYNDITIFTIERQQ